MAHQTQIQFYRGAEAGLPTLAAGEPGFTTDTYKLFIGDGATNHEIAGATLADGDYGDITVSSSGTVLSIDAGVVGTAELADDAVTDDKLRNSAALSVIGRSANSTGGPADIAAGSDGDVLRRSGTTLGFGTVATAGIADGAITYAKIQDISATSRVLGRKTAGAGDTEECTLSEVLDFVGSAAQGDILYRGAATWTRLGAGTSGHFLKTQGAGANPTWAAASGTLADGDYGDISVSLSGTALTIDNDAVTYAKIQNVSTGDRLLGRIAGVGDVEEITCTSAGRAILDDADAAAQRTTLGAAASGTNTDIGSVYLTTSGLKIKDLGADHAMIVSCGTDFTADRTLTIVMGDSGRSLTFTANASIGGTNTGDQQFELTGDVTTSLAVHTGSVTATIGNDKVTYAKMQNCSATDRLLGRDTAGSGDFEELTVGGGIEFTGSGGIQATAASDTVAGKIEIAVQSEMEAASSTTLAVTPGRVNFHPGVAKWWVNFNGTGTVAIRASHNVTSITDNGTGDYTVNIATDFSSADWAGWAIGSEQTQEIGGAMAAGTFPIRFRNTSFTPSDSTYVLAGGFGDQA